MPSLAFDEKPRSGVLCRFFETTLSLADYLESFHLFSDMQYQICFRAHVLDPFGNLSNVLVRTAFFFLSSMRNILFLPLLPLVKAVCTTCWGAGNGCKVGVTTGAVCPWSSQMTENTKAIAAAVGGTIVVGSLLTPRLLRVFTKPVLDTLAMVVARPTGGQPYDLTEKTPHQIQKAVTARYVAKDEAIMELTSRLYDPALEILAEDEAGVLEAKKSKRDNIKTAIAATSALPERVSLQTSTEGAHLFILARLSSFLCTNLRLLAFDFCSSNRSHLSGSSLGQNRSLILCYVLIKNFGHGV